MALNIVEFFGYAPHDKSAAARLARQENSCPFAKTECTKVLRGNNGKSIASGACTVKQARSEPIICCPRRLYGRSSTILRETAEVAFGKGIPFLFGSARGRRSSGRHVVALGAAQGGEIKLPPIEGRGGFFVDWILALVNAHGKLVDFVAVEVQSIDTTGNYRSERGAYLGEKPFNGFSKGGINWENVNKRILPQLIYKGQVLRRETLCKKGLFFICPTPVYERILTRVGKLTEYPGPAQGMITFRWYDVSAKSPAGKTRELQFKGQFTTTIEHLGYAFLSPGNMPPEGSYASAIKAKLDSP